MRRSIAMTRLIFIAAALCASCQPKRFEGPQNRDDNGRPTDESEGMNGYLTDPSLIAIGGAGGGPTRNITGRPGAVATDRGSPKGVIVASWQVDVNEIDRHTADGNAEFSIAVQNLACGSAAQDGAFQLTSPIPNAGALLLTASTPCSSTTVRITVGAQRARSLIKRPDASSFARIVAASDAGPCQCPSGQYYDKKSDACLDKPTTSGFGISCPEGSPLVCGCDNINYRDSCQARENGIKRWTDGQCR